jgi:hypothetical protein
MGNTMKSAGKHLLKSMLWLALAGLWACGGSSPGVELVSAAYGQALLSADVPPAEASFSFCVTQLKLEADDSSAVSVGGSSAELALGLVELGDGNGEVTWADFDFAAGAMVRRIKVEVHQDSELCGVDYSVAFGGMSLTKDLEFTFVFDAPQLIPDEGAVVLDLSALVVAYADALAANKFNNEEIGAFMENSEGRADADGN